MICCQLLTFMRGALPPNKVEILVSDEGVPLGPPMEVPDITLLEEEYVRLIEDLARLQRETGTFFTMPAVFTEEDLRELAQALALLEGKDVTFTWNEASLPLTWPSRTGFLKRSRRRRTEAPSSERDKGE